MRANATRPSVVLLALLAAAGAAATPALAQTSPRPPGYAVLDTYMMGRQTTRSVAGSPGGWTAADLQGASW